MRYENPMWLYWFFLMVDWWYKLSVVKYMMWWCGNYMNDLIYHCSKSKFVEILISMLKCDEMSGVSVREYRWYGLMDYLIWIRACLGQCL